MSSRIGLDLVSNNGRVSDSIVVRTTELRAISGRQLGLWTVTAPCVRSYVQISSPLIRRVTQVDTHFVKDLEFEPRVLSQFDFQLDTDAILQAVDALDFYELKGPSTCTLAYILAYSK